MNSMHGKPLTKDQLKAFAVASGAYTLDQLNGLEGTAHGENDFMSFLKNATAKYRFELFMAGELELGSFPFVPTPRPKVRVDPAWFTLRRQGAS